MQCSPHLLLYVRHLLLPWQPCLMIFEHHVGELEMLLLVCSVLICLIQDCCVFGLHDKWRTMLPIEQAMLAQYIEGHSLV